MSEDIENVSSKKLDLDEKVVVKNLAGWDVGFPKRDGTFYGDISIPKDGSMLIARSEIISQIQYNNKLFNGTDGKGSHATIYIDDKDTRIEVDFESKDGKRKQQILTEDIVKYMFELKTIKSFEENLKDNVVTRAEKYSFIKMIKKLKLNDYDKIKLSENYCRFKIENIE